MVRRITFALCVSGAMALTLACNGSTSNPTSPSATGLAGASATGPDSSTLKVTAPTPTAPGDGDTLDTLKPTLTVANSTGVFVTPDSLMYHFSYQAEGGVPVDVVIAGGDATTSYEIPEDLEASTRYGWRVRAESGEYVGPWSTGMTFTTPDPAPRFAPGRERDIPVDEAVEIIKTIYDAGRYNIGSSSTREQRNVYLERAVAALHYGHATFNPSGRDPNWCIKSGGVGRPQADDVIVRCDTRDAWDLVISIGADHYHWHTDYIGRLPGSQFVYAPSESALADLPN